MTKKKKLIETGKNILIAALLACTVVLTRETGLFSGQISLHPAVTPESGAYTQLGGVFNQAARPFYAAVTQKGGSRYGVKYDGEAVSSVYEVFSRALGEAMGASGVPEAVSKTEWQAALSEPGVFFDFLYAHPLSALAGWLGMNQCGELDGYMARRIYLSLVGGDAVLYFIAEPEGNSYRCDTSIFSSIEPRLADFHPNGARFVFESDLNDSRLDPYMLLIENMPQISTATGINPLAGQDISGNMLAVFGMNSTITEHYRKSETVTAYIEGDKDLRIDSNGAVSFSMLNPPEAPPSAGVSDAIQAAWDLLERSISAYCSGEAQLCLSSSEYNQSTGLYTVTFQYVLSGIPVSLPDGKPAAEITLSGGIVTDAQLYFRDYALSIGTEALHPESLMAIVASSENDSEVFLVYDDSGSAISARWKTGS